MGNQGQGRYVARERGAFEQQDDVPVFEICRGEIYAVPDGLSVPKKQPLFASVRMDSGTVETLADICGCTIHEFSKRYC